MKAKIIMGLALAAMSNDSIAQSLDIGGVELRIGQDINDALKSLSFYSPVYIGTGSWLVFDQTKSSNKVIGEFSAKNNKLTFVGRPYSTESIDVSFLYSNLSNELNRLGGTVCTIYETKLKVPLSDESVRGFVKKCGAYKLSYRLPFKMNDGQFVDSAISLYVGETASTKL